MEITRILVVDNEEPMCKLIKTVLERRGYQVQVAMNKQDALVLFRASIPDVVILDVVMPGGSGIDVLQLMIRSNPKINVVMVSGLYDLSVAKEALRIGAKDYFTKPINFDLMIAAIEKMKQPPAPSEVIG